MCPSPYLWFLHAKQRLLEQNYKSLLVPDLICGLWRQNSDFWTGMTNLYGSQIWSVVLCMQNIVISTRNTSLYVSQSWSAVLCIQKSAFRTRIAILYRSQTSPLVSASKTAHFGLEKQVSIGPRPHQSFCACKTAWLAPEWQVYEFQNSSVVLSMHNSVLSPRLHRQYCLQPSPVVLCMQNSDFRTRITSLCGSNTPPVVFAYKTATSRPE